MVAQGVCCEDSSHALLAVIVWMSHVVGAEYLFICCVTVVSSVVCCALFFVIQQILASILG